jgi:CheY-like chemotaxis protein
LLTATRICYARPGANVQPARVLVVDDEADIRLGLADLFADEGYFVAVAGNGAEGLDCARAHRPHLIVLDLMMPVMDGFEFLRHKQQDVDIASIPVIIVTARRQVSIGGCEVVYKPFQIDVLLTAAQRCLAGAGMAAQP